jgi:hypothetical protein
MRANSCQADSCLLVDSLSSRACFCDYILLITILGAFLEATALQLLPLQPAVVMRFSGIGS